VTLLGRGIRAIVVAALYLGAATQASATDRNALPLPAPGTYKLDRIQKVPFGIVREGNARLPRLLSSYTTGKLTLFTFFYGQCTDPTGCPLAWSTFEAVREKVGADGDLRRQVRLVFFTFDPAHDSPQILQFFSDTYKADAEVVPWHFIAATNDFFLKRTLERLGQDIAIDYDASGEQHVVINHMLKVFLIDRQGWVREVYTSSFFDTEAVVGDIKTLLLEGGQSDLGN
jgi:cytochrome oxidase Cu insertion factor (SCO1/SenC/PrrC family)